MKSSHLLPVRCGLKLNGAACGTDLHIFQGHMDGRFDGRRVIGHEMSGRVVELGAGVSDYAVGDPVVVRPLDACGACPACHAGHGHICQQLNFIGIDSPGAFQTSWTVPAALLHRLPSNIAMDRAALVGLWPWPATMCAWGRWPQVKR